MMSNRQAFGFIAVTCAVVVALLVLPPVARIVVFMGALLAYVVMLWRYVPSWVRQPHWLAVIGFPLSAILFNPTLPIPFRVPLATFFALLGIMSLGKIIKPAWWHDALPTWATRENSLSWHSTLIRWRWVGVALVLWSIATLQNFHPHLPPDIQGLLGISHHLQHLAWVGGFVALTLATRAPTSHHYPSMQNSIQWHIIVPIMLVAFAVRLAGVDDILRVPIDETIFMDGANYFNAHSTVRLFTPMGHVESVPRLYSYWAYLTSEMGGYNWFGLRLASIFIGMLSLPVAYLLADKLFNHRVALLTLAVLAIFPPHVHFSRTAMIQIADVLAGCLALLFMVRAVRGGQGRDALWAGVFLGTTQFFYDAGRLLFPLMALLWWGRVLLLPIQNNARRLAHSLYLLGGFVLTALPAYLGFWLADLSVTNRADVMVMPSDYWMRVLSDSGAFVAHIQRLLESIGRYVAIGEIPLNILQYDGQHPLVLEIFLPFFLIGVGVLLWRWHSPVSWLMVLWLGGTAFGSSLLLNHASDSRYVVTFPALAILIALGMDALLENFIRPQHRKLRWALVAVLGSIAMLYYLGELLPNLNAQIATYNYDGTDAVWRVRDLPEETIVVFIASPRVDYGYRLREMRYFGIDRPLFTYAHDEWDSLLEDVPRQRPIAFFIPQNDKQTPEVLRDYVILEEAQPSPATHLPPRYFLTMYIAPQGLPIYDEGE
jgi:4-amino-4-deoxy-L-arabinose transferase-like glycosyltransferase